MSSSLRQAIGSHRDVMLYTEMNAMELTTPVDGEFRAMDWDKFARPYRGSQQKYVFSDIGFNTTRDQAFVYLYVHCRGGFCSDGSFILLEKKNHQWRVAHKRVLWVS